MANSDLGKRLFLKFIGLTEERMSWKVKKAVVIFETDKGNFVYHLSDDIPTFQLLLWYFNDTLTRFMGMQFGTTLVTCGRCSGSGLVWMENISETCPKCKGGGQMIITQEVESVKLNTRRKQ